MYKIKSKTARIAVYCLITALITAGACTKYYSYKTRETRYGISSERPNESKTWIVEYIDKGKKSLQDGNYLDAYAAFDAVLKLDKDNGPAKNMKSEAFLLLHKPGQPVYNYLIYKYNRNDDSKKVREADYISRIILNSYPEDDFLARAKQQEDLKDVAYLVEGLKNVNKVRNHQAEEMFTKAIQLNSSNAVAYMNRAYARGMAGKVDKANPDFIAAEEMFPDSNSIILLKAMSFLRNGMTSSAMKATDLALEKDPKCFELWLMRSICLLKAERYVDAEKNLEELEKLYPEWWQTKMLKGVCAEKLGDMEKARAAYAEADNLTDPTVSPEDSRVCWLHGMELERLRKMKTRLELDSPYKLHLLVSEVVDEMFEGDSTGIKRVAWSKEPLPNAYGITARDTGFIQISCSLNSSQTPKEHIKKVIHHECLHAKGYLEHNKAFYAEEEKYPNTDKIRRQMYLDTISKSKQ